MPRFFEIRGRETRQHRHTDQERPRIPGRSGRLLGRLARCAQHRDAAGGVQREHSDTMPRRCRDRSRDGVRDVVKLRVEEDARRAAGRRERRRPDCREQLGAHLEPARRAVEAPHEILGGVESRNVERDGQAIARAG